ncbi:MAG: GH25 family lysozyme, partial [Acutalibacteraceae bacterium]
MKGYLKIKKPLCIFAALVFAVSAAGCKHKDTASETSTVSVTHESGGDMLDPENIEYNTESGAEVNAEELGTKKGMANGVDVSKWQGKIDWAKVKKAGIDFAIIRIGFRGENGVIYKDDCADYNIQQADKAGLLVGVYFFSTAKTVNEAEEEAEWTVSAIAGYPISYPVVYDCEGFLSENSRMYGLSGVQRTDNALAFLKCIESAGYEGMFYAAKSELEGSLYWDTPRLENAFDIWVARYPARPYPTTPGPDYGGKYSMWQYTNKGAVNGITGNADISVSYFTRERAEAKNPKARPSDASAPSADGNLYTAVSDEVTAKIETNLRDGATTKSNIVGTIKNGTFLKRTATGSNGWSKLVYNGQTVYAITSYLTTDRNYQAEEIPSVSDGFEPMGGEVTAKEETNLRAEPNTNSAIVATIKNGEFVTRVGVSPSGWTRLTYKGQTVYAKTSLLTTEVISRPSVSSEENPVSDGFSAASGRVTAKSETNLRTAPSTDNSQVVYTLKKGEFAELTGKSSKG